MRFFNIPFNSKCYDCYPINQVKDISKLDIITHQGYHLLFLGFEPDPNEGILLLKVLDLKDGYILKMHNYSQDMEVEETGKIGCLH